MIDSKNNFKNNLQLVKKNQQSPEFKKKRNATNKFLNANLKIIVFIFILLFLFISYQFFILPKFEEASGLSNSVIEQKKVEFVQEYENLQNYKNLIKEFSKINSSDVYRIEKMIPEVYTRDDIFTEVTYFLIQNGFKINSILIIDPKAEPSKIAGGNKRVVADEKSSKPAYQDKIDQLPGDVSSWVINLELVNINYPKLKNLLSLLENNLKLMDVYSLDFYPSSNILNIGLITYYKN